jgi:7-cyano-7-deazaguanine synthase
VDSVAVLASGGLDSAVLLADLAQRSTVFPVYVRQGLAWERQEQRALQAFLDALGSDRIKPVVTLSAPVREMYGDHWSVTGRGVPDADAPDIKVLLPGRNILLISLAAVWCSVHDVSRIAIGSLGGNPFPDATPEFFADLARVLSSGLGHTVAVEAPYRGVHKEDLIRRFRHLPLELTLTCMAPTRRGGVHCGTCNKCYERQQAFIRAGVADKTTYATQTRERGSTWTRKSA